MVGRCVRPALAVQGKTNEALDALEKSVDGGFAERWLLIDPLLENLRSEPRFAEIKARLEKRLADMRAKVQEMDLAGK